MTARKELFDYVEHHMLPVNYGEQNMVVASVDELECKIEDALSEARVQGFENCRRELSELDDDELAKYGLMRLPRDFDDVPIRVGDKMQSVGHPHEPAHEVIAVGNGCFILDNDETCIKHAEVWWHYKQTTVKDLLYEMYDRLDEPSGDDQNKHAEEIIAEYVDRLQLREE